MTRLFSVAFFAFYAIGAAGADPEAPSVRAYALNINHPPKEASREIVSNEYTGVYLFVAAPGRQIVAVDTAATKLTVTDDKGTDLVPGVKLAPAIATDKTKAQGRLYILGQKAPANGATRVRVKGEITFLCGVGEKTSSADNFAVKVKEKVEVGPAAFEVTMGKDRAVLQWKAESPLVKSITFTSPDGKPVGTTGTINLVLNQAGKVGQSATFTPPVKTEKVGIKVVHYEKVESVTVPVDTETGVGP